MPGGHFEPAFASNPQRIPTKIPRYYSCGSGRDGFVKSAQHRVGIVPRTADVYRAGTYRRPKKRTKEMNFPTRPPRYIMDGSGRDGFVFLHENCGLPKKSIFRSHSPPKRTYLDPPYAFDPNALITAKTANLRRRPNTTGIKIVARPRRPHQHQHSRCRSTSGTQPSPRLNRRFKRQQVQTNRLSQPFQKNIVKKGMYKGSQEKKFATVPWVGNSVRSIKKQQRASTAVGRVVQQQQQQQQHRTQQRNVLVGLELGLLN